MKQVALSEIMDFYKQVDSLSNKTIPLKGAFKINRLKKDLEKDYTFYQEKFKDILEKYAEKDENGQIKISEDGQQIAIIDGMVDSCTKEITELETMMVEIDNYDLVIEDLGDIECTPDELKPLMPFLN